MKPRDPVRRTGILCCYFLRNIAFYRSWYKAGKPGSGSQFWVSANGNFLDIAVLEWCKLFADENGKHHYTKMVAEPKVFGRLLLGSLGLPADEFATYVRAMRTYRDKFVAHLDDLETMHIPKLSVAKKSTKLLFDVLVTQEAGSETFKDASASKFYKRVLELGRVAYKR